MNCRLVTSGGTVSAKVQTIEEARWEWNNSSAYIAIVSPRALNLIEVDPKLDTDAGRLTIQLMIAGANRTKVIEIVNGYGDPVDWSYHSLDSMIAEIWQSDLNSGDEPENWIINEICRSFNVKEVTE